MGLPRKTLAEFYAQRVVKGSGCWGWTGRTQTFGYGDIQLYAGAPHISAHRASWTIHRGQIPEGAQVLHSCDNPPCTNPDHLFLGTHQDNMDDAWAKGRLKLPDQTTKIARTHCPNGHPFDEKNTYRFSKTNGRYCRICRKEAEQRRRDKMKREAVCR